MFIFWQFMRPEQSRFIQIIGEDGREAVRIDVAISTSVAYPEGSLGREIQFTTSYLFTEGMQYYVIMDPGKNGFQSDFWDSAVYSAVYVEMATSGSLYAEIEQKVTMPLYRSKT